MGAARPRDPFHFWLALGMSGTAFFGFWSTYFQPMFRGVYPPVSPMVHVHGWSFFLWYLLLPVQAGLVASGRVAVHRTLGYVSLALGAVMIVTGLIVSAVQVELALRPDGNPFWQLMAVPIFGIWILFTWFYVVAMVRRRRPADHKRYIMLASAAALSAATFRIVLRIAAFAPWSAIAGCLAPLVFVGAAMAHEYRRQGRLHAVYAWGAPITAAVIAGAFALVLMPDITLVEQAIGWLGRQLLPAYFAP